MHADHLACSRETRNPTQLHYRFHMFQSMRTCISRILKCSAVVRRVARMRPKSGPSETLRGDPTMVKVRSDRRKFVAEFLELESLNID